MTQTISRGLFLGLFISLVLACVDSSDPVDFSYEMPCRTFLSDSLWSFSIDICNVSLIYNEGGYYPNISYALDYVKDKDTTRLIVEPLIVNDTSVYKWWYLKPPDVEEFHEGLASQWFTHYGMINSDSLEVEVIKQAYKTVIIGSYKNSILALIRSEECFPVIISTMGRRQPPNFREIILSFKGRKNDLTRIIAYRPEWWRNY